jgi:hypothetical protein
MNHDQEYPSPPPQPPPRRRSFFDVDRTWLNVLLLVLTLISTYWIGMTWSLSYLYADSKEAEAILGAGAAVFKDPRVVSMSLVYMVVLIGILLAHEMGHYLTCRYYGLNATLPFFIPAPTLIGTMGAFIRIRSPITRKHQLFDVGVGGPLAGFLLTIPAVAYGLSVSKVLPALPREESIIFGEPLLFKIIGSIVLGDVPAGYDIVVHPVAFAGWVGTLVTAMNLFPIGQLDGGHVMYAVFGTRVRRWAPWILAAFVLMGIFFFAGWFLWAILIRILGFRHPPVFDENVPLSAGRRWAAYIVIVIFVLSFIPAPVQDSSLLDLLRQLAAIPPAP